VIEGVDYSYSKPTPAGLVAAGKKFVVRYGALGNTGKFLTAAELTALRTAGLVVVANVEEAAGNYRGQAAGVRWAAAGSAFFRKLGMPGDRPIYFSVDWDAGPADWPDIDAALRGSASVIGADRVGVYGGYDTIAHCVSAGTASWFWQTYAWSAGRWHPAAHLQQYKNNVALAGGTVDLTRAVVTEYGQWGAGMTTAPPALLAARRFYIDTLAGAGYTIDPLSVGIVGDDNHAQTGNSYHLGKSALITTSYSIVESPRDKAGLSEAAAALDLGYFKITVSGKSHDLRSFSLWLVAQCQAGTADTKDIREVIYSPDGKVVKRWDRLGKRTTGDSTHLTHTHESWFRDSEGRDKTAHLRRYFTEIGALEGDDMAYTDAQMRAFPWQYTGGGIPAGMSTLGVLSELITSARAQKLRDETLLAAIKDDADTAQILARIDAKAAEIAASNQETAAAVGGIPQATVDRLKLATATPEQKAELLRAVLGDDAVAVGRILAET
jgi:hypothetical protein